MNLKSSVRLTPLLAALCLTTACSTFRQAGDETTTSMISGPVEQLSCDALDTLRSIDSVGQIKLQFVNRQAEPLSLFWINYNGDEESYGTIAVGEEKQINTYFTHPWVLRDETGNCIVGYVSSDSVDVVIE